jgi:hypothetical protein
MGKHRRELGGREGEGMGKEREKHEEQVYRFCSNPNPNCIIEWDGFKTNTINELKQN